MKKLFLLITTCSFLFQSCTNTTDPEVEESVIKETVFLNQYLLQKNLFSIDDSLGLFTYYSINDSSLLRQEMENIRVYFWNNSYQNVQSTAIFSKSGGQWVLEDDAPKSIFDERATYMELSAFLTDSILMAIEADSFMYLTAMPSPNIGNLTNSLPSSDLFIDLREPQRPAFAVANTSANAYLWFLKNKSGTTILGVETVSPDFKFYNTLSIVRTIHPEYQDPTIATGQEYEIEVIGLDSNRKASFMAKRGFTN